MIVARPKLARTPPRQRVAVNPDPKWLEQLKEAHTTKKNISKPDKGVEETDEYATVSSDDQTEEERGKRKRRTSPPTQKNRGPTPRKTNSEEAKLVPYNDLRNMMDKLTKHNNDLNKLVKENVNTKVEIKTGIRELSYLIQGFNRKLIDFKPGKNPEEREQICSRCKNCTRDEEKQTHDVQRMEQQNKRTIGIQTDDENIRTIPEKITDLGNGNTKEEFDTLRDKKWDENIYRVTYLEENENPIHNDNIKTKIIWIDPEDTEMEKGLQRGYKEKYPSLTQMKGNFEMMEQITKSGNQKLNHIKIFKIVQGKNEQMLWDNIQKVKTLTGENEDISIHDIKGVETNQLQKMTEYIFREENRQVIIHTKRRRKKKKTETERKTYALVVEAAGDYKGTLKRVKESIQEKNSGNGIIGIRSSKDGKKIIISTEKDLQTVNQIEGALSNMDVKAKTGKSEKTTAIHIRGIDAITTREEVIEGIIEAAGSVNKNAIRVGELRPNINNTQAITANLPYTEAEKIIKQDSLKIGLVKCSVEKRIQIRRCAKCWSYDHRTRDCLKNISLEGACYKCGNKGHQARECTREEYCPVCDKTGHKAGTGKCYAFKQALSSKRKEERGREDPKRVAKKEGVKLIIPQGHHHSDTPSPMDDNIIDNLFN